MPTEKDKERDTLDQHAQRYLWLRRYLFGYTGDQEITFGDVDMRRPDELDRHIDEQIRKENFRALQ